MKRRERDVFREEGKETGHSDPALIRTLHWPRQSTLTHTINNE